MNEVACKAIKLLADGKLLLIGLDSGEVKVADKLSLSVYTQQRLSDSPILKIDQQMQAVIIQFKDKDGTISVYKPPTASTGFVLDRVYSIQTKQVSFTTFTATVLTAPTSNQHIGLVTVDIETIHQAKMWLLNTSCTAVESTELL
jgi:hypothetical protein